MRSALRYGVDGFPYLVGLGSVTVGAGVPAVLGVVAGSGRSRLVASVGLAVAAAVAVPTALGLRYVLGGKLALRDRVLDAVDWRGDETVVDLGAGRGLLAVGAAERTRGTVHCVDLFVSKDLSGNSEASLRANAAAAGVADRVAVHRRDVRDTGLTGGSVDVVVSALCLHNVTGGDGRAAAVAEIVRILRPGGTVVVADLAHVDDEYAPALRSAGFDVAIRGRVPRTFPPQRLLVARAPG